MPRKDEFDFGAETDDSAQKTGVNRRDFIVQSMAAVSAAVAAQAGLMRNTASAAPLDSIIGQTEEGLFFRDRLPDYQSPFTLGSVDPVSLFDWDFPSLITSAVGDGTFGTQGMPERFSVHTTVPTAYQGMPIAVVGAGSSGLAAGYELMKLGFRIDYYEMQTAETTQVPTNSFARPSGRSYSWDFGGNGELDGSAGGWFTNDTLTAQTVMPNVGVNVHPWGRRVVELGAMRYPATHITLRTYTDKVFFNDYYYGEAGLSSPWVPFRDPGLYRSVNAAINDRGGVVPPNDSDTIRFDTVYDTKGIFADRTSANPPTPGVYSQTDRVKAGTTLASSNAAVQNLTFKYFDLLYGTTGVLTPILELYSAYTNNPTQANRNEIVAEWESLIEQYDGMSLNEVLSERGWGDLPAYDNDWGTYNISLSEMFGEIGTGTGPFAMFYYSSFMELLRIALQAADSNQDYFLGGSTYQLQPFLTHFTPIAGRSSQSCLFNETKRRVVTDKVVAIEKNSGGGVQITTRASDGTTTTKSYTAAVLTASPAAMRSADLFPDLDGFIPTRAISYFKRIRINNNSKISVNFPNIIGTPLSQAFWMNRIGPLDFDTGNDTIVTTLSDKTIRQVYTFDNYHWRTQVTTNDVGSLAQSGTMLLNYGWDYNAQSWTALDNNDAVRLAWQQVDRIYQFNGAYDANIEWAIENGQSASIVWEKVDGFNAAWRMAQPGGQTDYGDPASSALSRYSEFETAQVFGMTSYNPEIEEYTGLFISGEATASPGLSGWVEGSIQTALQAVAGILKYLNEGTPTRLDPEDNITRTNFALQAHPGVNRIVTST